MDERNCERDDLVVEVAAYVPVLDDGDADLTVPPMLEGSSDRPYFCNNCEEGFKWFSRAVEHLEQAS